MNLLKHLRRQVVAARLPGILPALAVALALTAAVAPALWQLLRGPRDLYALAPAELNGSYAAAHIDTIWDWYADTVATDRNGREIVTSREYLVPLADGKTFIGVEVPARLIDAGDQVMEETNRWRADPENYFWNGSSLTVRGSIRPMDEETAALYYSFLQEYYGLSDQELDNFLPLVLVQGRVNGMDGATLLLLGLAAIAFLVLTGALISRTAAQARLEGITGYCAAGPYPEDALEEASRTWQTVPPLYRLRADRNWLVYEDGVRSWVLRTGDVAWVYIARAARGRRGWQVQVYSRSEPARRQRHTLPVPSERAARQVVDLLHPLLPEAVFGYSPARQRAYRADPARFGPSTDPDSRVWEMPLP